MRIVVPIHQVFDPRQIRISSQGRVITEGAERIMDAPSKAALEEALRLKDETGCTVDVIALGDPEVEALREAQAMGADNAYLLSDPAFAGGDAGVAAYVLSVGIQKSGAYDLVIAGEGGAISGPMLAEHLGLPQITNASNLQISQGKITAQQIWGDGVRPVTSPLPALITVPPEANSPRYAHAARVMTVFSEPTLTVWTANDLGLGAEAAQTQVRRTTVPEARTFGEQITGTPEEQARWLVAKLRAKGII